MTSQRTVGNEAEREEAIWLMAAIFAVTECFATKKPPLGAVCLAIALA
jgi:hypothetical protein